MAKTEQKKGRKRAASQGAAEGPGVKGASKPTFKKHKADKSENDKKVFKKPQQASAEKEAKNKRELKKIRQSGRPHFEAVTRAKEIWNVLRERDTSKEKKRELTDELMGLIQGKAYDLTMKHDAARVVQGAIQYGTDQQRGQILDELKDAIVEMSKLQYGHFVVQKLIRYCNSSQRDIIAKALEGNVVKLGTHNIAANVIEFAQLWLKPAVMSRLKMEFYGREFTLFRDSSKKNLETIIKEKPNKREEVMKNVAENLNKMIEKQLLHLSYVQSLLWEYFSQATSEEGMAMIPSIVDGAAALVATRPGAKSAASAVAFGSPKDRKKVMKALKGKVIDACNHPSGYLLILRIFDVVDDTVNVQKSILAEIIPELKSVAQHYNGRKVLLHLLAPGNTRYFDPDELSVLQPPYVPDPNNPGEKILTYKKDPEVRRQELLKNLRSHLEELCREAAAELALSRSASDVLVEVVKTWKTTEVMDALVHLASADRPAEETDGDESEDRAADNLHIMEHASGHLTLKRLVQAVPEFATKLLNILGDSIARWACSNRSAFVILALAEQEETQDAVKTNLKAHMKLLRQNEDKKGTALLLKALGGSQNADVDTVKEKRTPSALSKESKKTANSSKTPSASGKKKKTQKS